MRDVQREIMLELQELKTQGMYKQERVIHSAQGARIALAKTSVLNFCANNYLGLANDPDVKRAAQQGIEQWGYGMSSVRFICGTQSIHTQLERRISAFLQTDDTILFSSCFDANAAVFEPLLDARDAIISDQLNHASIIDGIRLCKARRFRYQHSDMADLERCLQEAQKAEARRILIATDGVFSMDGDVAKLPQICQLAGQYKALVMVDDSHATGYLGAHGRGTPELTGTTADIDIITTTFGKACGGASGGCISGRQYLIDLYRQRARPYLFSNSLAPVICAATLHVIDRVERGDDLRHLTMKNADIFRKKMREHGFDIVEGDTAIVAVMLYDENTAVRFADALLEHGIYVIGFCYPVVPKGKARIRVQLSAAHTEADIDRAIDAFVQIGRKLNVLK